MNQDAKKELEELNKNGFEGESNNRRKKKKHQKYQEDTSDKASSTNEPDNAGKKSCKGFWFLFLLLIATWGFLGYEKYLQIISLEADKSQDKSDQLNSLIAKNTTEIEKLTGKDKLLSQKVYNLYNKTDQLKEQLEYLNNQYESLSNKFKSNLGVSETQKQLQNNDRQNSNSPNNNRNPENNIILNNATDNKKNLGIIKVLNEKNDELIREKRSTDNQLQQLKKKNNQQSKIIELKDLIISSVSLKNNFANKEKLEQYLSSINQDYTQGRNYSIVPEIQDLEKYAINATISDDYLKKEFNKLVSDVNQKKLELNKDKSLTDKILYKTSKFVTVTKSDNSESLTDIDQKISIAKKYVEDSKFDLAYNQIKNIGSEYKDILSNWGSSVELYTNAKNAVDKIISKIDNNIQTLQDGS